MKFKIDENLPVEIKELLQSDQHDAVMVTEQGLGGEQDLRIADVCLKEKRILITLDLDFADIRAYPPKQFPGFMVVRVQRQDKHHILNVFSQAIPLIEKESIENHLWIIEETRVRILGSEET